MLKIALGQERLAFATIVAGKEMIVCDRGEQVLVRFYFRVIDDNYSADS